MVFLQYAFACAFVNHMYLWRPWNIQHIHICSGSSNSNKKDTFGQDGNIAYPEGSKDPLIENQTHFMACLHFP